MIIRRQATQIHPELIDQYEYTIIIYIYIYNNFIYFVKISLLYDVRKIIDYIKRDFRNTESWNDKYK